MLLNIRSNDYTEEAYNLVESISLHIEAPVLEAEDLWNIIRGHDLIPHATNEFFEASGTIISERLNELANLKYGSEIPEELNFNVSANDLATKFSFNGYKIDTFDEFIEQLKALQLDLFQSNEDKISPPDYSAENSSLNPF